jgi:hypothetical protein
MTPTKPVIDADYARAIVIPPGWGVVCGKDKDELRAAIPDLPLPLAFRIYYRYLELVRIIRDHRGPGEWIQNEIIEKGMILSKYPDLRPSGYR